MKHMKYSRYGTWRFILLTIIAVSIIALSVGGCSSNRSDRSEEIVWSDVILGEMLPEPPINRGKISSNSAESLRMEISDLSDRQYADYIEACKEKGFTVDAKTIYDSYEAYNAEGYKLYLSHLFGDMSIDIDAPMELTTITWPASAAGEQLPTPKSTTGKFSHERADGFLVYVGNTTKTDYDEYVSACSAQGFIVDYEKGEDYYKAYNSDGWYLSLRYEGNCIMSIDIDAPSEDSSNNDTTIPASDAPTEEHEPDTASESAVDESEPDTTETDPETAGSTDDDGLDPDFKAAMDSYESFIDEYVAFLEKYNANPTDISLLADYADYISKYEDYVEDFEKWADEDMNAAETAYYIEVQARVYEKLLEVIY